jgi:hypothetical protein
MVAERSPKGRQETPKRPEESPERLQESRTRREKPPLSAREAAFRAKVERIKRGLRQDSAPRVEIRQVAAMPRDGRSVLIRPNYRSELDGRLRWPGEDEAP